MVRPTGFFSEVAESVFARCIRSTRSAGLSFGGGLYG